MRRNVTLLVRRATTPEDAEIARRLIHRVYSRQYGVRFTDDHRLCDPSQSLEPWPHRFVLGSVGGTVVAAAGLYVGWTYAQEFGELQEEQIADILRLRGAVSHLTRPRVEYTKLVVHPDWTGLGIGRLFLMASHSRDFLRPEDSEEVPLLLACGKVSVFETLYRAVGMGTATIAPFPRYESHRRYHSRSDRMESRLILPEQDLPQEWFDTTLPVEVPVVARGGRVAV